MNAGANPRPAQQLAALDALQSAVREGINPHPRTLYRVNLLYELDAAICDLFRYHINEQTAKTSRGLVCLLKSTLATLHTAA